MQLFGWSPVKSDQCAGLVAPRRPKCRVHRPLAAARRRIWLEDKTCMPQRLRLSDTSCPSERRPPIVQSHVPRAQPRSLQRLLKVTYIGGRAGMVDAQGACQGSAGVPDVGRPFAATCTCCLALPPGTCCLAPLAACSSANPTRSAAMSCRCCAEICATRAADAACCCFTADSASVHTCSAEALARGSRQRD